MNLVIRCLVACFACVSFLFVSSLHKPDARIATQSQEARKESINPHTVMASEAPDKKETATSTLQ